MPKHRVIERSARFAGTGARPLALDRRTPEIRQHVNEEEDRSRWSVCAVVAAIAASEDIETTLHFCVKVSPAPERLSAPGFEAVLTACCFGETPLHFNVYQELTAASRCRKSYAV